MFKFDDKQYITDKEAALRYGFSAKWFMQRRWMKLDPPYVRICGKIYYDMAKCDEWFRNKMQFVD